MLEKLWATLTGKQQAEEKKLQQIWATIVGLLALQAAGQLPKGAKAPTEAEIEQVLAQTSRTVADMAAAVERLVNRKKWRAAWDRGRAVGLEREKASAAVRKLEIDYDSAVKAMQEKLFKDVLPHHERIAQLDLWAREAEQAHGLLKETVDAKRAELAAEVSGLQEKLTQLRQEEKAAHTVANNAFASVKASAEKMQQIRGGPSWGDLQDAHKQLLKAHENADAEAEKLSAERRTIEQQIAAIEHQHAITP
jgi:transcriptional regulator of heat shock response